MNINPVNRFFLYLLLLPSRAYLSMGINITHLQAILNTKLMMDDRRPNALLQARQKKEKKPASFATIGTMFLSAVLGLLFLLGFVVGKDPLTNLTIYFSFYVFVLASTLITDFTSVLIDVRDNMIILPKPVNDKTFVLARLLHIVIHVSKIIVPMSIPGMIYMGVKYGAGGLLPFLLEIFSATFFTIFLINAAYILILRITTPDKFKNIISYFQIGFAVIFYGGYQLVPRLIGKAALVNYSVADASWRWFAPSYWFAAGWQFLHEFRMNSHLAAFVLTLFLPFVSMWIVIKFFAPSFNRRLSMISGSEGGDTAPKRSTATSSATRKISWAEKCAALFTKPGAERMGFLHTWKMTGRSRDFKMRVYPSIGYLFVYAVIMFINSKGAITLDTIREQTGAGKTILIGLLYFSGFMLIMAVNQLVYSEKYKAAWIYYVAPVDKPGMIISGAVKSVMVKFYFPIMVLLAVPAVIIIGPAIIPSLLLGACNQFLTVLIVAYVAVRELPFSVMLLTNKKGGSFIRGLFSLIIPATLAILHYWLSQYILVLFLLIGMSAVACWLMIDALRTKTWKEILVSSYE